MCDARSKHRAGSFGRVFRDLGRRVECPDGDSCPDDAGADGSPRVAAYWLVQTAMQSASVSRHTRPRTQPPPIAVPLPTAMVALQGPAEDP